MRSSGHAILTKMLTKSKNDAGIPRGVSGVYKNSVARDEESGAMILIVS